jgi:hypothetical protein
MGGGRGHRSPRAQDRHEESEPEERAHEEPQHTSTTLALWDKHNPLSRREQKIATRGRPWACYINRGLR